MKIIFYLFRNGTVVEECLDEKRCKNISLNWIKKSDRPEFDVWVYARKIANSNTNSRIYQFYYHSEEFQCFDTVFFIGSLFAFLFAIAKISLNCETLKNECLCIRILLIFSLLLFLLHRLCKKNSKSFARRFFFDIQVNLDAMKKIKG